MRSSLIIWHRKRYERIDFANIVDFWHKIQSENDYPSALITNAVGAFVAAMYQELEKWKT